MSKKKRTSQQEKAEIRRQAFASAQGKVQRLNKNIASLMENNKILEEENIRLARSNHELKQKIVELESKIAFIQMTEGLSPEAMEQKAEQAKTYYRYTNMIGSLIGSAKDIIIP